MAIPIGDSWFPVRVSKVNPSGGILTLGERRRDRGREWLPSLSIGVDNLRGGVLFPSCGYPRDE
ncbi:hypothetical protein BN903_65 [Halorubrum sp. AJ67]|nr:hypothetical protein BN903_65 [Halorubrum sp. AJ67]